MDSLNKIIIEAKDIALHPSLVNLNLCFFSQNKTNLLNHLNLIINNIKLIKKISNNREKRESKKI